jgi:hypothetical protein
VIEIIVPYTNKNIFISMIYQYYPQYNFKNEFIEWWYENLGPDYTWKCCDKLCVFSFKNKEKAVLFKLTWIGA